MPTRVGFGFSYLEFLAQNSCTYQPCTSGNWNCYRINRSTSRNGADTEAIASMAHSTVCMATITSSYTSEHATGRVAAHSWITHQLSWGKLWEVDSMVALMNIHDVGTDVRWESSRHRFEAEIMTTQGPRHCDHCLFLSSPDYGHR